MLPVLSWNGLKAGQKQGATESQVEPFRSCAEVSLARLRIAHKMAMASNLLGLVSPSHVRAHKVASIEATVVEGKQCPASLVTL